MTEEAGDSQGHMDSGVWKSRNKPWMAHFPAETVKSPEELRITLWGQVPPPRER